MFTNWKLSKLCMYYWDFMEASWHRHDQLLTSFPAPASSLEDEGGAENAKLLIIGWSFWWPAPIQEPPGARSGGTSVEQNTLLVLVSLRKLSCKVVNNT